MNEMENAANLVGMGQPRVNGRNRTEPAWVQVLLTTHPQSMSGLYSRTREMTPSPPACWLGGWGDHYRSLSLSVQVASYVTDLREPQSHCLPAAKARNGLTTGYFRN